jgi:hypothetical protein
MKPVEAIRRGQSFAVEASAAVKEFHAAVAQADAEAVLFFCSADYDLDVLGAEMRRLFDGIQVFGCTGAGFIGPRGYQERGISGASFARGSMVAVGASLAGLEFVSPLSCREFVQDLLQRLEARHPAADSGNSFALMLIDGLSGREEALTRSLQGALGRIPLTGGSAGDSLQFTHTKVYCNGRFAEDAAVLLVCSTDLPFVPFMTQHFVAGDRRVVVTAADAAKRIVYELDGRPAAEAYADLIGVKVGELDAGRFAASPMVVLIGGAAYVRSIGKLTAEGALKFYCAIDEGIVLRAAHGADLVGTLEREMAALEASVGPPQLVIGFDCILRRLEILQRQLQPRVEAILERSRVVGFSSFGEQYRGVHVNQTFTGVAIGGGAGALPRV